jgi:VWFA-related protein
MARTVEGKMNGNYSRKFVLTLSLIVMFLWLSGNGCTSRTAESPAQTPAQIKVSSRQIVNGNVVLNNVLDQTVTIQNTGSTRLFIGQIAQADPLALPFSIVGDDCSGRAVQPSATCSFKVQFSPTNQGAFTDSFDIPSDASNENSVTVDVTGSGKALRVAISQVKTDNCSTGVLELIVTVADQNNAPLAGLALGAFQLKENGVPQVIDSVSQVLTAVPISVAAVLDYTTSVQNQIPTIEAASIFFTGMLNAEDEAAIIKFAQKPQLMQDFTADADLLTAAINTAPSDIGRNDETRLYDTLWFAVEKTAARQKNKAIVLVSDGRDESYLGVPIVSVKTLDEVIAYAAENDVALYTVGLGDSDGGVMNRLAIETGGQYYYITNVDQLAGIYQAISNILFGQYSAKYVSSLQGGSPIMLNIDVVSGADEGAGVLQAAGCP